MYLADAQRTFYEQGATAGRWSSRELDKQINLMLYERTALSRQPEQLLGALPMGAMSLAPHVDAFKDPYVLDFLGLVLCGSRNEQVVELLLADGDRPTADRIKIAHYLLLNSEEAIKQRLAEISAAYDEIRRSTEPDQP